MSNEDEILIGDIVRFKKTWECNSSKEDFESIDIDEKVQFEVIGFSEVIDLCAIRGEGISIWTSCNKLVKVKK